MGIRKHIHAKVKGMALNGGLPRLRLERLEMPERFQHENVRVAKRRAQIWTAACDREIIRLVAWQGQGITRTRRKRRRRKHA